MHTLKKLLLFLFIPILCVTCSIPVSAQEWYTNNKIIRHAGGKVGKHTYTNSREAVYNSLRIACNVIEMDFLFTSDHVLVCKHDWKKKEDRSYEHFIQTKIENKYSPLSAEDLLDIYAQNPGIYLVVDTKEKDYISVYKELVRICQEKRYTNILPRIIVQIYKTGDYKKIKKIYPFKHWIFTTYLLKSTKNADFIKVAKFCKKNKIKVVAIPYEWITPERISIFNRYKLKCYTHTINSKKKYQNALSRGAYGIYSDTL